MFLLFLFIPNNYYIIHYIYIYIPFFKLLSFSSIFSSRNVFKLSPFKLCKNASIILFFLVSATYWKVYQNANKMS